LAAAASDMAGDLASQAKDTVSVKGTEAWEAAKAKVQEWNERASARVDEARAKAKTTSDSVVANLRRQQHDLRDEIDDMTATARNSLRDEDTRNTVLVGIAGVAIAAALGIACQKRLSEKAD
jgi:vacuolar-type H+-ATPase subunit H